MAFDFLATESIANLRGRISRDGRVRLPVLRDHGARSHAAALTKPYPLHDGRGVPDPDVVLDHGLDEVRASRKAHRVTDDIDRMISTYEGDIGSDQAVVADRDTPGQVTVAPDVDVVTDGHVVGVDKEAVTAAEASSDAEEAVAVQLHTQPGTNPAEPHGQAAGQRVVAGVARVEGVRRVQ